MLHVGLVEVQAAGQRQALLLAWFDALPSDLCSNTMCAVA